MAARAKTPTYIAELPLAATQEDERVLDHCRYLGLQADHCMVKEANRRLGRYYKDRAVHELLKRVRQNGYKLSPADKKVLAGKRMEYGLSEYDFHAYLKVFGRRVSGWLDANTVQKIATRVWQAASAVLFGRGGRVRYRRYDQFLSLEGKTNTMGIRYKDGCLIWGKRLKVPVVVRGSDRWLQRALQDRVKYCRVVARWHKTRWKYHLQLVLEGTPPTKPHRKAVEGEVGLDMGPSAIAAVSEGGILFQELGGEVASIEAETARLLRKLDRQRRANNPGNYDAAGRSTASSGDSGGYGSCPTASSKQGTKYARSARSGGPCSKRPISNWPGSSWSRWAIPSWWKSSAGPAWRSGPGRPASTRRPAAPPARSGSGRASRTTRHPPS